MGAAIRIAVLVSGRGRGTNFGAILNACREGQIPGDVLLLVSTTPDTPAVARAEEAGVETVYLAAPSRSFPGHLEEEAQFDIRLEKLLVERQIDLVCLAGFMRKVGPRVIQRYRNRIMNIHPSLLPAFSGSGMFGLRVHEAVLAYGAKLTGCTVQFINEEYDAGPIILQRAVPVEDCDTAESLAARVLKAEHQTYTEAIRLFGEGRLQAEGRRVHILPPPTS